MATNQPLTLYYAPQTRSLTARMILEELGAPHQLHILNMKIAEHRQPAYLAVNPLGKVPALTHGDALVTEQVAIALYLGDLFPESDLVPGPQDPGRAAYVRWLVFYAACFEPGLIDKHRGIGAGEVGMSPYGDFDAVLTALENALTPGPYLLGERMSLADIQWGVSLWWTVMFGMIPERPAFKRLIDLVTARPSFQKILADDAALVEAHAAAAAAAAAAAS